MDYGQNKQYTLDSDPITDGITSGVGLQSDHLNVLPTEENLNTNVFSERDYGPIGNAALNTRTEHSNDSVQKENALESQMQSYPEIELAPPPLPEEVKSTMRESDDDPEQTLGAKIYSQFADGKVSINDLKVLQTEEKEKDPESFYEFVQELREAMLKGAK